MLKVYNFKDLNRKGIEDLCRRNVDPNNTIRSTVVEIIDQVT